MGNQQRSARLATLSIAGLSAILAGCGGGGGGDSGATSAGTLKVALTDAPACGYRNVNVTVDKVRVHKSESAAENDGGWQDLDVAAGRRRIDLLELTNGVLHDLGQTALPAGRYNQIRLVLASNTQNATSPENSVVLDNQTNEIALVTPSGQQSGLKLNAQFEVPAGGAADLVLDFDACKSIVRTGGPQPRYLLKPVIQVIPRDVSGSINGSVPANLTNAVVSVQQDGNVVRSTVVRPDGTFTLSPVPQNSSYVVVVTAANAPTAAITGVPVTVGTSTSLGALPINANTTPQQTISGSVSRPQTPATAEGAVRATQSFAAGPTVEVAYSGVDLSSGTGQYSFPLSPVAPLRGAYGTTPISLTPDTATAGKYQVRASASGYATQTSNVIDVSGSPAVQNFTLVPQP